MEEGRNIKINVANCFYKHLGKKPAEITAQTDFSVSSISLSENKKELGDREMIICDSSYGHLQKSSLPKFAQKTPGRVSLHTSAIISGLECCKIMSPLFLPSINNCIWI